MSIIPTYWWEGWAKADSNLGLTYSPCVSLLGHGSLSFCFFSHFGIRHWVMIPVGSPSHGEDVTIYVCDINQPSLPTPLYSILVSISVFMALSTVFHSINSPDNCPLSHSVLLVLSLPYWSFQLSLMKVSFSPDVIPSGWLGSKHQLTN